MNLLPGLGWTILIQTSDMQHERRGQIARFVQSLLDPNAVITDCAIRFESHRQEPREFAPQTESNRAYSTVTRRMFTQKIHRSRRVFDSFGFVETLIKLKGFLPFGFALVSHVDAAFLPPKQIGTDRDKATRRVPVAGVTHELIDAEDFLKDDDAGTVAARRQSKIGIEFPTVGRFNCGHDCFLRAKRYTRCKGNWLLLSQPLLAGGTHVDEVTNAAMRGGLGRKLICVERAVKNRNLLHRVINRLRTNSRFQKRSV